MGTRTRIRRGLWFGAAILLATVGLAATEDPLKGPQRSAASADSGPAVESRGTLSPLPAFVPVPRVYNIADLDVSPPVALNQVLPPWNPPWSHVARRSYTGQLQIVVDEKGNVTSATILEPSFNVYDGLLLGVVKQWRYRPALKQGHAVQYRRTIDYVLKGTDQTSARP